ncbi:amidohydrolase family protein [Mitsuaria sp. WAJ17]|uniref:amidohydrolase family protein n=1 Tax=Mitsuaria sp. WAJ17 TaxID=2761452 RepID=UPI0015FFB6FC|nr:amidohydrolase family protein [Mitsuaria sp. WAJ17]MBB2487817.1 amidohydrolase family protein [Mitsuaria sp. WAJ17]
MRISVLMTSLALGATAQGQPAVAPASGQPQPFKASAPLAMELHNARWFDGQGFQKGTLYVVDGKFTKARPKRIHRRLELRDQYLIPPLAEANNHNLQSGWGVQTFGQRYLQDGVFYAAMQCGDPDSIASARPKLGQPDSVDVSFTTACITSPDGHPLAPLLAQPVAEGQPPRQVSDFADRQLLLVDSPEQAQQKWPLVAPRKTDWLKIILAYSDRPELRGDPTALGRLGLSPETAAALVRLAHKDKLPVSAHVETAADFRAALEAGVDQIGHVPGYFAAFGDGPERFRLDEASAARAASHKTQVLTATVANTLFPMSDAQRQALRAVLAENLRLLKAAGAQLLLGSDNFPGTSLAELHHLAGLEVFSPAELLKMASISTPRALFPKRRLACFEEGCEASFLVLVSNPLDDLRTLDRPLMRVKQGRLLTQLDSVAEASDASTEATAVAAKAAKPVKGKKTGSAKAGGKGGSKTAAAARKTSAGSAAGNSPRSAAAVRQGTAKRR